MFWVLICTVHLPVCSCHVAYAFQSEFTLYSCLNVKVLLARSMSEIWSLSDCNSTRTHNNLVGKRKLKDLAKLTKWLSCVLSTYLYSAFDCVFFWCHLHVSEWIYTEYQGAPSSKKATNLKVKWLPLDSNPEALSSYLNTQQFGQID